MSNNNQHKSARITLKINPGQKEIIKKAAEIRGLDISSYIRYTALEKAKSQEV